MFPSSQRLGGRPRGNNPAVTSDIEYLNGERKVLWKSVTLENVIGEN